MNTVMNIQDFQTPSQQPLSSETGLEIAIIGMAGKFPGAKDIQEFWDNLSQGIESIRSLSNHELQRISSDDLNHPDYVKAEGVFDDLDQFDANFFGFSPREAEVLDPQQRWFLEIAWAALEDAGYDAQQYSGAIGIFAGAAANTYLLNLYNSVAIRRSVSPYQLMVANDKDFLTTRVAYKLNLTGPAVTIQTACSSSLVAVHLACQSLLSGECDMALAGGVSLSEPTGYRYQEGGIYSPDGHCRAFDITAQGTVAGSGLGTIVLKRLADARQDGDSVYAIIKGSAINNDGANKVSYTAPSLESQVAVIRSAQLVSEVEPESISYIETHGTGTAMGDPIEVTALTQAFRQQTSQQQFCGLGSLKPSIGHLDAAAGIASLIKTALALHHRQLPASLNVQQPHPLLHLDRSPFYIVDNLTPWDSTTPLRAGVSSFGIGGTNSHVVLQETDRVVDEVCASDFTPYLFPISAKTPSALVARSQQLEQFLSNNPNINLAHLAHTLQVGRQAMEYRHTIVASSREALTQQLRDLTISTQSAIQSHPAIAFLFPGQGCQYPNMAKALYEKSPRFRSVFDRGCEILADRFDLKALLYSSSEDSQTLAQTQIAQPALFLVEYAIAQCLLSLGIKPQALIGHSIGEYVAATLAGVFSFEAGLALVADRAFWMQSCEPGAMLSVSATTETVSTLLEPDTSISVINSKNLCVISGLQTAIDRLESKLIAQNISCRQLKTSHGFHSSLMQAAVTPLRKRLQALSLQPPQQLWISNITGDWVTPEQAIDPEYWISHLLQPVQMSQGLTRLVDSQYCAIEVGAGTTMTTLFQQAAQSSPTCFAVPSLRHPQEDSSVDQARFLQAIGQLWTKGIAIDWQAVQQLFPTETVLRRLHLPTYPFERQRYWVEAEMQTAPPIVATAPMGSVAQPTSYRLFSSTWTRSPIPTDFRAVPAMVRQHYRRWLILSDTSSLAISEQLLEKLNDAGQDAIFVTQGDRFEQTGYRRFSVCPTCIEDWQNLFEDLEQRELIPDYIIDLGAFTRTIDPEQFTSDKTLNNPFTDRFWQTIHWAKTAAQHSPQAKLLLVTQESQIVLGTEAIDPTQAMLNTLKIVLNQEFPALSITVLDTAQNTEATLSRLIAQILNTALQHEYLNSAIVDHSLIAYRGAYRWQQQYVPIAPPISSIEIQPDRLYVVIGDFDTGLGKIWEDWLSKLGATVEVIQDEAELGQQLDRITQTVGKISGIFYATSMSQEFGIEPIATLTSTNWESAFQQKVINVQALIEAVQHRDIPFCCVQSSLSSVLGGFGLAAYASASAVIDALITQIQSETIAQTHWYSVNWDAHQADHATDFTSLAESTIATRFAIEPLSETEVQNATQEILQFGQGGSIIVAKGDFQRRLQQWVYPKTTNLANPIGSTSSEINSATPHDRPNLTTPYLAPRTEMETTIAQIWQDLLGLDAIGIQDSFFDLGGHSLLAVQVISRIRDRFGIDLAMRSLLFEAPTIEGLSIVVTAAIETVETIDEAAIDPEQAAIVQALLDEIQSLSPEAVEQAIQPEISQAAGFG